MNTYTKVNAPTTSMNGVKRVAKTIMEPSGSISISACTNADEKMVALIPMADTINNGPTMITLR